MVGMEKKSLFLMEGGVQSTALSNGVNFSLPVIMFSSTPGQKRFEQYEKLIKDIKLE
jgi:hypothetical protein